MYALRKYLLHLCQNRVANVELGSCFSSAVAVSSLQCLAVLFCALNSDAAAVLFVRGRLEEKSLVFKETLSSLGQP